MTEDVPGLARECRVVSRARALTEWVGAGRPVTAKGVLRKADVADAATAIGVTAPAKIRTAADLPEMHHPWLLAQAAGWLRVEGNLAIASSPPPGDDPLTAWLAGFDAVLREESHDRGRRGARLACQAVIMALTINPPTPRGQLEEAMHALMDHSQPGDITAVYEAFPRGMMPVDAALEVLADFGAVDGATQPTLTPLGRWAWHRLRPASADGKSAAELLTAVASLDEFEAAALAKQWFESRPLSDACHQLLQLAATTAPTQRISVVHLIASLGEATTSAWHAALAVPNLSAHAAAVLSHWDTGPEPTGRQQAWLATEYALATLAADGPEAAAYDVRDYGGLAALETGAHPDLAELRRAIDEFTASGVRERVLQLKIALVVVRPTAWRRVLIPASATLGDLHRVIQVVFEWDDDHLHMFTTESGDYADPYYELDGCDDEDLIRLSRVLPRAGAKIRYLYDFGESWNHTITLEKTDQPETRPTHPACTAGSGDAPVEDWDPDSDEPGTTPFDRDRLNHRLATLNSTTTVG